MVDPRQYTGKLPLPPPPAPEREVYEERRGGEKAIVIL